MGKGTERTRKHRSKALKTATTLLSVQMEDHQRVNFTHRSRKSPSKKKVQSIDLDAQPSWLNHPGRPNIHVLTLDTTLLLQPQLSENALLRTEATIPYEEPRQGPLSFLNQLCLFSQFTEQQPPSYSNETPGASQLILTDVANKLNEYFGPIGFKQNVDDVAKSIIVGEKLFESILRDNQALEGGEMQPEVETILNSTAHEIQDICFLSTDEQMLMDTLLMPLDSELKPILRRYMDSYNKIIFNHELEISQLTALWRDLKTKSVLKNSIQLDNIRKLRVKQSHFTPDQIKKEAQSSLNLLIYEVPEQTLCEYDTGNRILSIDTNSLKPISLPEFRQSLLFSLDLVHQYNDIHIEIQNGDERNWRDYVWGKRNIFFSRRRQRLAEKRLVDENLSVNEKLLTLLTEYMKLLDKKHQKQLEEIYCQIKLTYDEIMGFWSTGRMQKHMLDKGLQKLLNRTIYNQQMIIELMKQFQQTHKTSKDKIKSQKELNSIKDNIKKSLMEVNRCAIRSWCCCMRKRHFRREILQEGSGGLSPNMELQLPNYSTNRKRKR